MADSPLLVLAKIATILDAFTQGSPRLTAVEVREATGLPSSTSHRLLRNLVEQGFLDRSGESYAIGGRLEGWARSVRPSADLAAVLSAELTKLRDGTQETACFFRPEGASRVCTAVVETLHGLKRDMYVGRIQPLHVGSAGRVILAWNSVLLEEVLLAPLPALTESTITDPDALRAAVDETRRQGFAITTGERVDDASGLSAPVFDANEQLVGAITVMGPTLRLSRERCEAFVGDVRGAAQRVTHAIGGRFPH